MKYHFIINPVAGKQDSSKVLVPEIKRAAAVCGIPETALTIQLTNRPAHAHFLALEAVSAAAEQDEEIRIYAIAGWNTFEDLVLVLKEQDVNKRYQDRKYKYWREFNVLESFMR